jgi:hypothetical protein
MGGTLRFAFTTRVPKQWRIVHTEGREKVLSVRIIRHGTRSNLPSLEISPRPGRLDRLDVFDARKIHDHRSFIHSSLGRSTHLQTEENKPTATNNGSFCLLVWPGGQLGLRLQLYRRPVQQPLAACCFPPTAERRTTKGWNYMVVWAH